MSYSFTHTVLRYVSVLKSNSVFKCAGYDALTVTDAFGGAVSVCTALNTYSARYLVRHSTGDIYYIPLRCGNWYRSNKVGLTAVILDVERQRR